MAKRANGDLSISLADLDVAHLRADLAGNSFISTPLPHTRHMASTSPP